MFTIEFWKATGERALWTFAQAALAVITVDGLGFADINWINLASVAGVAAVASVLKSIIVNGITGTGPAITSAEQVVPEGAVVLEK